ncbi:MAG: phosphoribosylglycinamide formyltransferase [Alphaproteobacteria bacterium]|nr:phosphoribosylglycinamide formyltransferase [Alphaproteobacteria bacterium]
MEVKKINLAVLISGRGSNLQALIDACESPSFPARISVVVSNIPDAYGLERARKAGIDTEIVPHKNKSREEFEDALTAALNEHPVDLVCLAGFMRILTPHFITVWPHIINIHPSLLPDYKGLDTHGRALKDGKTEAGCTVHHVIPEMDSGPVIVQKRVPILKDDTPETLAARVLEQEHIAYPEAVRIVAQKLLPSS